MYLTSTQPKLHVPLISLYLGSATFTFDYFCVKKMKKLSIWVFTLLVLTACGGSYENETQLLVKHLRVVFTEAPATHAIVSWTATAPTAVNEIYYGEAPISAVSPRKEANKSGKITLRAADIAAGMTQAYYHHVELNDLKPATRYYLRVCNDGKCSEDFYFKTADPTNHNISLLSGGDSRMREEDEGTVTAGPHTDRRNMNLRLKALLESDSTVLALAHGADYCVTADWRYLHNWFEDWSMTTTNDKRLLHSPLGLNRHTCLSTLVFAQGHALEASLREQVLAIARELCESHPLRWQSGVTSPDSRVVVVRVLSAQVENAMALLRSIWLQWRQHAWQLPAVMPRIWAM